eukprot:jgi/Bigna1/79709/fgenesh1_pg.64_\
MGVGNMTISLHDGTSCKRGEGLVFEESSASLDQLGFLLGPPFTISVRFVSKEIKSRTRIFDFSNGGGKHNIFLANTEKSSQMLLGVVNSNSFTRVKTGLPLVQNGCLYLNGLKKYNGTIQIAKVARSLLYLGKSPHGDPQLNGAIREIAFWDKGINATLASQLSSARGCYKRKQVLRSSTGTFDHVFWKSQNSRSANAILLGAKPTKDPTKYPTHLPSRFPTPTAATASPESYPIASPSVCPSLFSIPTNSPLTSLPTTSHPSLSPSTSPSFLAPSRCPITEAPATCIPTTLHPTFLPSQSPATQSPLSRSPLTRAPFTFSPSSKSPTTSTPTSGVPTQVPSTRVPSSVAPSSTPHTGKPTTRAPSSSPITSAPTTVAPTAVNLAALRSTWESSFTAFTVEYSLPTDTQQHSCLEYFLDEDDGGSVSDKLGLQPNCHWLSQTTLKVTLGKGFSLELESTIKLRGGVVHDLSGRKVAAVVTLLVQHSAVPILRPDAVLWGPQGAAPCETLQLTTDGSSGSAGKPLNISWTLIQSPANGEEAKLNALRVILDSATQGNSKSITFESDLLAGGLHVFFVQIRNWVGGISDARWQITKSNAAAPVVTIPGQTSMSIARSEVLAIRTIVSPPACNATSLLDTEYTSEAFWSQIIPSSASNSNGYNAIVMNGSSFSDDSISIPKPQNSYLLLPANILRMGETYGFNLRSRALYQGHVVGESNTVFQVRVRVEPVQAVISGGSAVTVIVRNGLESSFDASLSTDPSNSAFPLAFEWTMVDAGGNSVPITSHLASVSSPTNSSILKLQTGDLQPGSKYKLWVKVTGQTINGTARFSSASQEIYTSQANVPLVRAYISSSSTEGASGEKKFNINKKLNLLAEVSNYRVSEVRFSWSCASFNLNVSNPNNLRSGTDSQYFVVAANALLAGAAYQFRVETQEIYGGSSSFALVDVTTNGPPILGNCSALPNQGLALSTVFQLQCREWVDDDVPLSFKFSNRLSSGAWAVVSEFQSKSFFNTLLPAGSGAGDVMPLRASIRDVLGAQTYYDFQAVVETEVIDTSVLTTSIDQRVAEGDTQCLPHTPNARSSLHSAFNCFPCEFVLTASLLVQGMATYLRSSSAENINNTEKASSIERLLEQTTSLSEVSSTSAESSENTASLCSAATDFNSPDEINANTRNLAANLVENLLNSSVGLSSDAIKSSMSCMSNTLDSLVLGSNTESDDSGSYTEELEKVREKTRQTTLKLSEQMLQDSLPGEEPVEVSLPRLSLVAAKTTIADAKGTQLRSTAGVSITLPDLTTTTSSSSSSSSTEDTIINTLEFKPGYAAPYPGNTANISGVLSLDIKKNGRILNVKDVAYFPMYFPQKLTDLSVDPNAVPICQFWNTTLGNWSSSGLRPATDSSLGNVGCETTHLTSFSFRIGFEFNTFGEKDINAEAFELQQPIMAFLFAVPNAELLYVMFVSFLSLRHNEVFGIYVIGSFWACKKDLEDAHDMPEFHSELFWRKRNKLVYDTMWKVRSFRILKERFRFILSVRHPWSSVFSREKGDYLNSFKRFTILTTLIFNSTAICSLLEGTKQQIPLLPSSVAVAVVAMILTLPVPILMNKLFSRPVPPEFSVQIEKPDYNCVFLLFLALIAALLGDEIDLGGGQRGSSGGNGENTDGFEEEVEEIEDDNEDDNHNPFARQSSEVAIGLGLMTGGVVAMKDDRKETKEQPNQPRDQQKIHDNKTSRNLIIRQNGLVRRHSGLDLSSCLASEGWIVAMEVEEQEENDDNDYDNKDHDKKHKTPLDTYSQRSVKGKVTTGARSADYSNYNRRMRIRHKRPLCCGIFYPGPYVYNQEYVTTDIAGILFAILVIFGCWFITAVLAFRAGNKTAAWVISEILCLIQDVVSRFVVSGMLEMFVFAPFVIVFCACIFCYTDPATEEEEAVPRGDPRKAVGFTRKFEVGRLGFSFQNLKVCNVVKGSQADRVLAPGMEILMVNYKPVNSDREIYTELQSGHRIGSHIVVSFDRSGRCQRRLSMKTIPQLRSTSGKFLRTKLPETVLESSFVLDSEANKNRSSDILKPSSVLSRTTTNLSRQNRGHRDSRLNSSSPRLLDRASELELQQIDSIPTMGKITQLDNVEEEDEKKRKKVMFKFKEATEGKARIFLTSSTTSGVIRESVSSEHKIHAMRSSVLSEHQLYASMGKGNRKSRFRTKV